MTEARQVHPLHSFFNPSSVAIIGASSDPEKLSGRIVRFLRDSGFQGKVFPVNRSATEIQGYRAFTTLSDIPDVIDHAIIVTPAASCAAAMKECAAKGIRAVQVFSSGFAEVGTEGARMQEQLLEIARAHGIRLLGPNCLGIVSVRNRLYATFSTALEALVPEPGGIAIATQSGAFGSCAYSIAIQRGLGLSRIVSTGNEADVDVADCIDYLAEDGETRVICASIEGCRDGDRLRVALAKAVAHGKPVIIMKIGTTAVGMAAAASHTGSLAGNDNVYDTVFAECGAWRAQSIEEMLDIAALCSNAPLPQNRRAGIVTLSGGIGVLMADAAERHGLTLPAVPEPAAARIAKIVPFATVANPMDTTAQVSAVKDGITSVLEVMLEETDWSTMYLYLAQKACEPQRFEPMRLKLKEIRDRHPERCLVLVGPSHDSVKRRLEADGFVVMTDPTRAVAAAGAAAAMFARRQQMHVPARRKTVGTSLSGALNEADAKRILADFGIPVLPERICMSSDEAVRAAAEIGLPVVAKILSEDIPHKTEIGGVVLNLRDEQSVARAFADLMDRACSAFPCAKIDGVLIAPMVEGGVETIIGVHMDDVFGPMVVFGLGGIAVELFKDVAFASAPLSRSRAMSLVRGVRSVQLLDGLRGQPACDIAALVDALVRLSEFAVAHASSLQAVDINPFLVRQEDAVCLDALIVLKDRAGTVSGRPTGQ
jgi:acyl-CoA synthetase (NDP forming)